SALAWSGEGRLAAAGMGGVRLLSSGGRPGPLLEGATGSYAAVAWDRDGKRVVAGDSDGSVHVWRAADGAAGPVLKRHSGAVLSLSWHPDGRRLASAAEDGKVLIWDVDRTSEPALIVSPIAVRYV